MATDGFFRYQHFFGNSMIAFSFQQFSHHLYFTKRQAFHPVLYLALQDIFYDARKFMYRRLFG